LVKFIFLDGSKTKQKSSDDIFAVYWLVLLRPWKLRKAAFSQFQIENNENLEELGTYTSYKDSIRNGPCTSFILHLL